MLQTVYSDEALSRGNVFEWLKDLKRDVKVFSVTQKAGVLQPLEVQARSQMSMTR
jgi:hypothetical protein